MKYYLLKMELKGIKNIDKKIELNFYKKNLQRQFDPNKYNVKAIYGANGAGKTAIVLAADMYQSLVLNSDYLTLNNNNNLMEFINKVEKSFSIDMTFVMLTDDNQVIDTYKHSFILSLSENNKYLVTSETLWKFKGLRLNNDNLINIYSVNEGELTLGDSFKKEEKVLLIENSKNLLELSSLTSIVLNKRKIFKDSDTLLDIIPAIDFAFSIDVLLYNSDKNLINFAFIHQQIRSINKQQKNMDKKVFNQLFKYNKLTMEDVDYVEKDDFDLYKNYVSNLETFLKVFKDDLIEIAINKEEDSLQYICEMILVYKNNVRVSRKLESTGIKKLMNLYAALCRIEEGGIVFIDEFDANLHDVLLIKLVEYIKDYSKGQFIFTTHNLGPMDVLQSEKCSIDFLSNDSRVTSWVKRGNASAANMYKNGQIKYSPFNIEPFNFMGVFRNGRD